MAYEEITLEDMERFLTRGYRVLRPKKGASRGELYYDLNLSDEKILIRVWTSIHPQTGVSAQSGSDAIRVTLLTRSGRPLMPKSTIVKRTGRWKATLQERIDDYIELYEAKTDQPSAKRHTAPRFFTHWVNERSPPSTCWLPYTASVV